MHSNVQSSTVYNRQDLEANQMSINRRMDKEEVVYVYNGIVLSHKILSFVATWIDLEIILLSEVNQTEKDKCYMILLICGN